MEVWFGDGGIGEELKEVWEGGWEICGAASEKGAVFSLFGGISPPPSLGLFLLSSFFVEEEGCRSTTGESSSMTMMDSDFEEEMLVGEVQRV